MQNATDLAKHPYVAPSEEVETTTSEDLGSDYVVQMTTNYLQGNQTDFHILPACNTTACVASGDFINDDGTSLDLSARNSYTLAYEHAPVTTTPPSPALMTITVRTSNVLGLKSKINANDLLNKIEIYDATTFGMDLASGATYAVTVNFQDTAKPAQSLGNASWAEKGDKLEILAPNQYAAASVPVQLFEVDTIVFTKAA